MKIFEEPGQIQSYITSLKRQGKIIGFVPTMGALHEGHLSLIRAARKENDIVVVSIYVNPTQFGQGEDFDKYPRTFDSDKSKCEKEEVDIIFAPNDKVMYPDNFQTLVSVKELQKGYCGDKRPGHFDGVSTVVAKLFNICMPDIAYFGQKDFQQFLLLRQMIIDLNFPIKIKMMPIIRESDGLALSSRNSYLSKDERQKATILYTSLKKAKDLASKGVDISNIKKEIIKDISNIDIARLDYFEIADARNLKPLTTLNKYAIALIAVYIGQTRLIDNIFLFGDKNARELFN